MADITFSSYFTSVSPATISQFSTDITAALPELKPINPDVTTTFGWCTNVYYNVSSDDIRILSAFVGEFNKNNLSDGQSVVLISIPFYNNATATTPLCYLGARVSRTGQSVGYSYGFFTDAECTTAVVNGISVRGISGTVSDDNFLRVGTGFFTLPGREDEHLYPNPWDRIAIAFWYTYKSQWADDYFKLKSTSSNTFGNYLEQNSGLVITAFDVVDLYAYSLDHGLAGPFNHFENDFSPEAGPASDEDGMGQDGRPTFDDSSDTIDLPTAPTIGVSNVGFVNVYKTGLNSLQNMGIELFPPLTYTAPAAITGTDVTDAVVNGFNQIVTFLANIPSFFEQMNAATFINYIIDCHVLPVTPNASGTSSYIKVGSKQLTAQGYKVTSDYKDVDCGTISLSEYYTNFADFLTSFKLYLPFVGFVPAKPEWFYRESLNVTYRFNVIDGSFMAFVRSTGKYVNNNNSGKTIVGQYGGNACMHLPITGATYASMVSGLVGAGAGAVAGAANGNIGALATSAIAAANAHGDIAQSNAYASSVAFLGCRRPFVLIERPVSNFSKTYAKEKGIPSNISRKLSQVSGFSVVGDVHLDGITATDQEKHELEQLLRDGVIF